MSAVEQALLDAGPELVDALVKLVKLVTGQKSERDRWAVMDATMAAAEKAALEREFARDA